MNIAPPAFVHPTRYSTTIVRDLSKIRLFVLHTTEGSEGVNSAEGLVALLGRPGTTLVKGSDPPRYTGAGYHWALDTDQVIPCVTENRVAYAAPGANNDGVHIVFPGRAGQTRAEWLDVTSRAYIDRCAELLVLLSQDHDIPLVWLTVDQVLAGESGICDHKTITDAYHRTDHWDVGPDFPSDVLLAQIESLTSPDPQPILEEDDAMKIIYVEDDAFQGTLAGENVRQIKDGDATAELLRSGAAVGSVTVKRIGLKGLTLLGPEPTEGDYVGATQPGRTRGSDFLAWKPHA